MKGIGQQHNKAVEKELRLMHVDSLQGIFLQGPSEFDLVHTLFIPCLSRFVRWSDGSLQLLVGEEVLDVFEQVGAESVEGGRRMCGQAEKEEKRGARLGDMI